MNEQEHDRAERIFLDALASENGERAALVTARCAEDDELKQTVFALLSAHEEADDFLEIAALDYPLEGDDWLAAPDQAPATTETPETTDAVDSSAQEPRAPETSAETEPSVSAASGSDGSAEDSPRAPLTGGSATPQVLEPGTTIGNFTVESAIAFGGMGVVYRAKQARPSRSVALKVLRPSLLSITGRRRFEREAHILARLEHPNIARVFEAGTHGKGIGSLPYFAMEYVKNSTTITAYANDRNLDTTARLELFAKVCHAVAYGHEHSVIHRDIKPENVLVDVHGEPKVIDFGVARVTDADITFSNSSTSAGEFLGTLQYMSPEQCEGNPKQIDERSDVYSLGVLLYELVCNEMPYDVRSMPFTRAINVIQQDEPRSPRTLRSELSRDLETVILKSLEKKAARRYASVTDLADEIRRILRDEPIIGRPTTIVRKVSRSRRTRKIALVATLVLALFGAAWVGNWIASKSSLSIGEAIRNSTLTVKSREPGSVVFLQPVDVETGLCLSKRNLGLTPLQLSLGAEGITSGQYRLLVESEESRTLEFTRYFESDNSIEIEAEFVDEDSASSEMLTVAAGKRFAYRWQAWPSDGTRIEVDVPAFLIDKYEVTNAEYRKFAEATDRPLPWYFEEGIYEQKWDDYPVAGVEFEHARAYAEWCGKRLPTSLEWELAALASHETLPDNMPRESLEQLAGVGLNPSKRRPNDREEWLELYSNYARARGSFPKDVSPSGAFDMVGNVSEWTESIPIVRSMGRVVPERYSRIAKGFNWATDAPARQGLEARLTWTTGEFDDLVIGFRCARSLDI